MADPARRWPDNAPGPWFVDAECIVCTVCSELAPDHFELAPSEDHDRCHRQPRTPAEWRACEEAAAACPVEAIGVQADAGRPRAEDQSPRAKGIRISRTPTSAPSAGSQSRIRWSFEAQ